MFEYLYIPARLFVCHVILETQWTSATCLLVVFFLRYQSKISSKISCVRKDVTYQSYQDDTRRCWYRLWTSVRQWIILLYTPVGVSGFPRARYIYLTNKKSIIKLWYRPKVFFYQNSALQAACDTLIACITGYVYPREGYRSVTPLLIMPGSTGLRRWTLFIARKLYNPHWGGQNQTHTCGIHSMHETMSVTMCELPFGECTVFGIS